jgi:hypothetical protein
VLLETEHLGEETVDAGRMSRNPRSRRGGGRGGGDARWAGAEEAERSSKPSAAWSRTSGPPELVPSVTRSEPGKCVRV